MARTEITTPIGKLAFPHLFTPQAPKEGGDARYQAVLIFDADAQKTEAFAKLREAVKAEAQDYFKGQVPSTARNPLIRLEKGDNYVGKYEGFNEGDVMIRPWSKYQPGLVNARRENILIESDVWAGQLWRAIVSPAGYNNSGNKGVMLFLNNMQQAKFDMPRMDGRKSAADSFGELEDDSAPAGSGGSASADDFFN